MIVMEMRVFRDGLLALYFYLLFNLAEVHLFPMEDCRTSDIDLLIVFENYDLDFCINQENNTKFIDGVLGVFLAPGEENLARLHVAVASFTSSGPVMYVPFQNQSRQDFMEKIQEQESCQSNTSSLADKNAVLQDIVTFINDSFQESYGSRNDAKDVVIMLLQGNIKDENYDIDTMYQTCLERHQGCGDNVFFIKEMDGDLYHSAHSISIESRSQILSSHVFSQAMCNQCQQGWFTAGNVMDESEQLACYRLEYFDDFTDWSSAEAYCQEEHRAAVTAVKTEDELNSLNSEIQAQLQVFQLDKTQMLDIRNDLYLYIYIDIRQSDYFPTYRDFCGNTDKHTIHNWILDNNQAGSSHKCGAWLFKFSLQSQTMDENNEAQPKSSLIQGHFTQGWVNILCSQPYSKFALCKRALQKPVGDMRPATPKETSIIGALERGEYVLSVSKDSLIISIAMAIGDNAFFDQLPQNIRSNVLPFSCEDNYKKKISYSFVCDHSVDCDNERDEEICQYRTCDSNEYMCDSSRCIPSEAVCDLVWDCLDGTDEQSCRHTCAGHLCCTEDCIPKHWIGDGLFDCHGCNETGEYSDEGIEAVSPLNLEERCLFLCNRTECVYRSQLNDGFVDCQGPEGPLDETIGALDNISECRTANVLRPNLRDWAPLCIYIKDRFGSLLGCRDRTHLQNCASFQCPEGYIKCSDSYCIPVHYIGNGLQDCPGGEDEYLEFEYCKGHFYCPVSLTCVHPDNVCDGHIDCGSAGEDELNCHVSCAPGFICRAGTVTVGNYDRTIPLSSLEFIDDGTRYVDLSGVDISNVVFSGTYAQLSHLVSVSFVSCSISNVGYAFAYAIGRLASIYWMDLRYNEIQEIPTESIFHFTSNLRVVDLSYNKKLTVIGAYAFYGSTALEELILSHTCISTLHYTAFLGPESLQLLNLSHTLIDSLLGYNFLNGYSVDTLDLRGTIIRYFERDTFDGLSIQSDIYIDTYTLCCPDVRGASIPEHTCNAPPDFISSCKHLIDNGDQRILLWVIAVGALLGNTIFIVYRAVWGRDFLTKAYGVFALNLSVSDFIMGIYLVIIAGKDELYRDVYVWNDSEWRHSVVCKIAGVLSTLSRVTSMLFICLITFDSLMVIRHPYSNRRISKTGMIVSMVTVWVFGLVISVIPLLPIYSDNNIYASNGLCLGLQLSEKRPDGWGYSMAVFVVFNIALSMITVIGQFMINQTMTSEKLALAEKTCAGLKQDAEVTSVLSWVVWSDFLCWFPIEFMGLLALNGNTIDREAHAWTAILILTINSATNPLIYTLPFLEAQWERFKLGTLSFLKRGRK